MTRLISICFLALAGMASTAPADSVDLDFRGVPSTWSKVNVTLNIGASTIVAGDEYTGPYLFETSNATVGSGVPNGYPIQLYCFELQQYTDPWGDQTGVTFAIEDPADGPRGSGPPIAPMLTNRSNLLKALYAAHYDEAVVTTPTKIEQKALQIAIWEIVHETPNANDDVGSSFSVAGGNFVVNNDYESGTAITMANTWLAGIDQSSPKAALKAFTNDLLQDQLWWDGRSMTTEVPCPDSLVNLLGLGLMVGLVAMRRRRQKSDSRPAQR